MADPGGGEPLLRVRDLTVSLGRGGAVADQAVRGVSYDLEGGATMAIIGESGSGKSIGMKAIMGLLPANRWTVTGSVRLDGRELVGLGDTAMNAVRGRLIGMIFQEAQAALNPSLTVGYQIAEVLRFHLGVDRDAAHREAVQLLERVGVPDAAARARAYPHQFSGGMQQRAGIAMAIATRPKLLIADEPTTALDVTVQAQVLDLLRDIQAETGIGIVFITHDLAVAADVAETIAVMYAGRIVEMGPAEEVYLRPRHPYTVGLLRSRPAGARRSDRLTPIEGSPRPLGEAFAGCSFRPRCASAIADCARIDPPPAAVGPAHLSRCLRTDVHV